jgi:PAS domain S-box-containing protein
MHQGKVAFWQLEYLNQCILHIIPDTLYVYIYDLVDQCNIYANRSLAKMLGYTDIEIQDMGMMGLASLIHPEDVSRLADHFQRLTTLRPSETIEIEYRMQGCNGKWCWLHSHEIAFVHAENGVPLQVIGVVRDITEQRMIAESLRSFSSQVEHSTDMVMITDVEGVVVYVNSVFEQVTGYTRSEIIGQTPALLKSGRYTIPFYRHLWNTIYTGQVFQAELVNRRKNGELFCEAKTIVPIQDEQGTITHFLSLGQEVDGCALDQDRDRNSLLDNVAKFRR